MGQFHFVFRCHLPGNVALGLAMVQPFGRTEWQPNTPTDCPIRQKLSLKSCHFIALEHIVRGVLLSQIFGVKDSMHYIVDCIDEVMHLETAWDYLELIASLRTAWKWFKAALSGLRSTLKLFQGHMLNHAVAS
ncbi:hypothetical protein FB451DRAFT_1194473 [Mycena latifolia]|nr:hypothetical protein FB451DRAFT_1194473 [Mycena latifolia]